MSDYATVYDWLQSNELLDHALPAEPLEFFRTNEAASTPCKIFKYFTGFRGKSRVTTRIYGEGQHTQSVDVRGFSSEERASIDLNTVMTFELHDALCASASRARVQRL